MLYVVLYFVGMIIWAYINRVDFKQEDPLILIISLLFWWIDVLITMVFLLFILYSETSSYVGGLKDKYLGWRFGRGRTKSE